MGQPPSTPSGRQLRSHTAARPGGHAPPAAALTPSKRSRAPFGAVTPASSRSAAEFTASGPSELNESAGLVKKRLATGASARAGGRSDTKKDASVMAPPSSELSSSASPRQYFLFKSEGETRMDNGVDAKFSIDDLAACPDSTTPWDGVRNYEARNIMRQMRVGDLGFFYHSNVKEPGIVGIVEVVSVPYVDPTQFTGPHPDPKATPEKPRWDLVDVRLVRRMRRLVSLREIRVRAALFDMSLLRRSRLSVQPVRAAEWEEVLRMEQEGEVE